MTNTVFCQRKQQTLTALTKAPYPGEIGKKILSNISQQGWQEWLAQQTKLINEYRLRPSDKEARQFLKKAMLAFLFEGEEQQPSGYIPPKE